MMRFLSKLIGFVLLIAGVYFLSKNIILGNCWLRDIRATGSVLAFAGGVLALTFSRETSNVGWLAVGIGIVLSFASGCIHIVPTTLWYFFIAFVSLSAGHQMYSTGRVRF
jgi:general stress protein CsbA